MQSKITHQFDGHPMALAVAGLVLFGTSPNWDDRDGLDKVTGAIVTTQNEWIVHLLNRSEAFNAGTEMLEAIGKRAAKAQWQDHVAHIAAAFLEEQRGMDGLMLTRQTLLKTARTRALDALRAHGPTANAIAAGTPPAETPDKPDEAPFAVIDMTGDVEAQLAAAGLPDEFVGVLRGLVAAASDENPFA